MITSSKRSKQILSRSPYQERDVAQVSGPMYAVCRMPAGPGAGRILTARRKRAYSVVWHLRTPTSNTPSMIAGNLTRS